MILHVLAENEQIVQDNGTDVDTVDTGFCTPMLLQDTNANLSIFQEVPPDPQGGSPHCTKYKIDH